jgi:hypothetical protein
MSRSIEDLKMADGEEDYTPFVTLVTAARRQKGKEGTPRLPRRPSRAPALKKKNDPCAL